MILGVLRFASDKDSTLSLVAVDGRFVCFGLEDEYRTVKVPGETRIPAGTYKAKLRQYGGMNARYAGRFPDMHRGMIEIADVPGFTDILIHVGNREKDTDGCLLVGMQANATPGDMSVPASVTAYRRLYPMIVEAASRGELSVVIKDEDVSHEHL